MEIYVTNRYLNILDQNKFNQILTHICGGVPQYNINSIRRSGRFINFEHNGIMHYVLFSGNDNTQGRNSYVLQYLPPVIKAMSEEENETRLYVYYLPESGNNIRTDYHINAEKLLKTIGVDVINERDVFPTDINGFDNFDDFYHMRLTSRGRNRGNASTYFFSNGDSVSVYGKLFGANGMESAMLAVACSVLLEGIQVIYFPVRDNNTTAPNESPRTVLEYYGITIDNRLYQIDRRNTEAALEEEIRDQAQFKLNLAQKYGAKKCYLCNCEIEKNIIAAHIHRVTDIKRSNLPIEEKIEQAVSQNNGLWLCGSHDKLFEHGYIYFDERQLVIGDHVNQTNHDYIESITLNYEIEEEHFNDEMEQYLEIHKNRVTRL